MSFIIIITFLRELSPEAHDLIYSMLKKVLHYNY